MQILLNCLLSVLYVALLAVVGLGSATGGDGIVVDAHDNHDHEDEAFIHLSEMLQAANPDAGLDIMAAGNLLHDLGEECLNASQLFAYLGVSEVITEDMFANASIVGSYFLRRANCVQLSSVSNAYAEIDSSEVCKSHIQSLLHDILSTTRVPVDETLECFSASDILHEDCVDHDEEITEAFANIFIKLLEGRCVAPPTAYFVDEVFELYATEDEDALHEPDLNKLLTDLKIGRLSDAEDHDLEEDHDGHDHRRKRRDAEDEDHHEETKCYTVDEFLSMGKYETNDEGEKILTKAAFLTICPAMIHQIVSNSCVAEDHVDLPSDSTSTYTTAQKYGYGTISVFIISCLAFIGLLLFHSIGTHSFQIIMQFFIALGIGTLSGDALLHLIPEVVGLHGHSAEETDGGHEDHEEDQTYVWRLLVVVGGIYLFYLFENVLKLWNRVSGSNIHLHNHDNHGSTDSRINDGGERSMSIGGHHMTNLEVMQPTATTNGNQDSEDVKVKGKKHDHEDNFCGAKPIVVMVFIGDVLHNFGDGIAIGAAFSSSWVSGIGTSIAIFCHELPHEFGDFAIYLKNGMSKWKALFLNFGAACGAFVGLYIGLSIAEKGDAREWLLAVIAGMFLYIALVDIMHEMIEEPSLSPILQFFVQNLGMVLGWTILLLLALFEDQLRTALA